tara:strand:+ start:2657 stop:3304 length:648 start_codon:yes stop_codon:yes gene_type:complete
MNEFICDTIEALELELWQLENEANVRREAQEKKRREQEELIKSGLLSEAQSAGNVITQATVRVVKALEEYIQETLTPSRGKPSKSVPACRVLSMLDARDHYNMTADCIAMCLNGVGTLSDNALIHAFGEHVEHEFMLRSYREQDRKAAEFLKESMTKQAKTAKQRYKQVAYSLSANRMQWQPWSVEHRVLIGQIIYQLIIDHSDLFEVEQVLEVF